MKNFRSWVEIEPEILIENLQAVRLKTGKGVKIAAVVKADAYGHGLIPTANIIAYHTDWLAAATVEEGALLRDSGIKLPILVMSPILSFETETVISHSLTVMVEDVETARLLSTEAQKQAQAVSLHLKLDTGMSRFGARPENALMTALEIAKLPYVHFQGLASHFACADDNAEFTQEQLTLFNQLTAQIEQEIGIIAIKHIANSAAAAFYPESHLDMVRIGSLLYGIFPESSLSPSVVGVGQALPSLSWKSRITSLRSLSQNTSISYGATYRTKRSSRIATLPVGYGDGYLRTLSNKGIVIINAQEAPVVGRVCMDQMMVDVTDCGEVNIGDIATLIGGSITVPRLAALAETTYHEITTRIGARVGRIYL